MREYKVGLFEEWRQQKDQEDFSFQEAGIDILFTFIPAKYD